MSKRSRQTKMVTKSRTSQLNKATEEPSVQNTNSCVDLFKSDDPIEESTSIADEPDASFVEDILRYFKMPKFIEPIVDSEFVIAASKRFDSINKCAVESEAKSADLLTDFEFTDFTSTDVIPNDLESSDLVTTTTLVTYDEFDSPASPPPSYNNTSSLETPIIPISPNRSKLNSSVVNRILENFDERKSWCLRNRKFKVPNERDDQILISARCRIVNYLLSDWTENEIVICCNDLSNVRPGILSKCIIEIVMNSKDLILSREFTPPAPALPKTHQKLIVLIKRISRIVDRFEDLILFQLEKTLFVLNGKLVPLNESVNLTHLFIGLTDCMDGQSEWSCVLFIYKCFYYFIYKPIPMIYPVLMAYPTLLPKFEKVEEVTEFLTNTTNILQATFVVLLINTNLFEPESAFPNSVEKKKHLSNFLRRNLNFPYMNPTIDTFVDILVNRIKNSDNLDNISYSLILLAKRNGTVWADAMIQQKLLPQLNNYLVTISDGAENDRRISVLLSAISSIIKTYLITKDISNYQQIFYKILDITTRHNIQEAAVMALLRTSRFGIDDVYKRIYDWKPSEPVSRQCYSMLSTFLYRKGLGYWKQFEFEL